MSNFTYTSAFNLSDNSPFNPAIGSSSSSSSALVVASDDDNNTDDACSICLEPFTLQDPSTVTSCKHEYHLQCIIEWSQRSKECPICWQLFVLRDPASQELLAAVEKERLLKTRNISSSSPISIHHSHDDFHSEEEESQFSSFDEQFLRHLTEAAHRRCLLRRRDGQISSSLVSSSDPTTIHPTDLVNLYRLSAISHVEHQNSNPCPSPGSMTPSPVSGHSSIPADSNNGSRISPGPSPSRSSQSPKSPEASSLPEAIKSKLAAASAKYKESISKSKQGLKEKLLARNNSVKELSKGVQREMNAGIAGVARMIERMDFSSKRFGGSAHVSTSTATASGFNFSFKGKRVEANSKSNNNGDKTEPQKLQGGETC
ncbi:RING-H2 group F1A [Arabidopsis thaliana]|uniref:E3 ubiquitin-protein ligase RHF1A n=2 Tax=Arabidopsis thaliana TaxID=3702 RepID=RHF1A_ARATH|nr:RING-H2 group F1A [Arabidopsis thaliana]Q4TU14.1 RecName: Full=E3 ubiquitin-protein ligase RHF1A; AltName: Full=RING-H2 finger F1a; AltName: Full=RING-H2 zinc finger protein RHF1a; AltName: Full=RING-type E3 ubiquitin transferase RHF1A [Arabidopsis thaliana]AAY57608.1 RING finger family protein [Arabidopsis thaliana]AEE83395.1 RING-H2 group F1A [Arabidopsis thaliana]|eukprot:NP_193158.2 RING-H2 group F1A [Arabidopsis thaliana]